MTVATPEAPESVVEYTTNRGISLNVDRDAGIIRGVKILGTESKNGRTYSTEAIVKAVHLYEGSKVNVNHPNGDPRTPRDYRDRLGKLEGIQAHADGLYGNLHFNPRHALAEHLLWDAEHAPENVGLSHNVSARMSRKGGKTVVEEITGVVSVDLVADPATTRGLFESTEPIELETKEVSIVDYPTLTTTDIQANRPDLMESISKAAIEAVTEDIGKAALAVHAESEEAKAHAAEFKALTEEVDTLKVEKAASKIRSDRDAMIAEAKLPDELVTDVFKTSVYEAVEDTKAKELIEDRQAIAKLAPAKTQSKEQESLSDGKGSGVTDGKGFANAIT